MKTATIMIVENNADLRNTLRRAFGNRGYLTWSCPSPEIAMSIFNAIHPSVVLLDLDLNESDPFNLMDIWHECSPHTRIIVQSQDLESRRMQEAMEHGAYAFVLKSHPLAPLFELLGDDPCPLPPNEIRVNGRAA